MWSGLVWSVVPPQMGDCLLIMLMALSSLIDGKDLSHRVDNQPPSRAETTQPEFDSYSYSYSKSSN